MAPPTQQAVKTVDVHSIEVKLVDVPKPGAGEILVRNKAVTLNPTDDKHYRLISPPGTTLGCDFAGVVDTVGTGVSNVKQGDRVSGFVHGGYHKDNGSFAEYVRAKAQNVMKVPDNLDDAQAASMGIAGTTAVQALFQRLGLKAPAADIEKLPTITEDSPKLLVWSGATGVGHYAVQLGAIAGYYVIATASPKNHEYVKSLGAQEVHDYRDADLPSKIAQAHPDLSLALDCISESNTQPLCVRSLGTSGGKVVVLLKPDKEAIELRNDVKIIHTLIYTSLGDQFGYGRAQYSAEQVAEDQAFFKPWLNGEGLFSHLFAKGLLKPSPIKHLQGGLHSIHEGLKYIESGKVSGEKLAYTISV